MNIAVYCGSKAGNDPVYAEEVKKLGDWMGRRGHRLVYGGGFNGLMGVVADSLLAAGGEAVGVLPNVPYIQSWRHPGLNEWVDTETMAERKTAMIERADAFFALPGGIGTLDEITEVMALATLGLLDAPVVFYNVAGYYDKMKDLLGDMEEKGFGRGNYFDKTLFSADLTEIEAFLAPKA